MKCALCGRDQHEGRCLTDEEEAQAQRLIASIVKACETLKPGETLQIDTVTGETEYLPPEPSEKPS
jgi:hypothetical protein